MGSGYIPEASFANRSSHYGTKASSWARNLSKSQLGGVIFGTDDTTIKECLFKQIFGLPAAHFAYVKNIDPGLPLFLFNYTDKKLHGIFEAASPGKMNINPYGWTVDGSGKTKYPAQVQICVRLQCQPLSMSQYRPIIADNYFNDHKFRFELDHAQATKIMSLMVKFVVAPGTSVLQNTVKWRSIFKDAPLSVNRVESEELMAVELDTDLLNQLSQKSESTDDLSLFDGEDRQLEAQSGAKGRVTQEEKDQIFLKLRDMTLKNKGKSEAQSYSLPVDAENEATTNDMSMEDKDSRQKAITVFDGNASVPSEIRSKDNGNLMESLDVQDVSPIVLRLIQEVDELKTFKKQQTYKMYRLEEKLVEAETEIKLLKSCLEVESEVEDFDPKTSIFLIGGYDGESWLSDFASYSPTQNVLKRLRRMSSVCSHASLAQLNGELYLLGGGDGTNWFDTVESYSIANDQWTPCPSMNQKKGSLAAVGIDNKIFAMGGGNGLHSFSDVEMLDLDVERWINTRSMLEKRFSLAAVELNGVIYATGGFDGVAYLKSCEMFDRRDYSWKKISSMNSSRGCHSMVVLNEKLYAVGGFDGLEMVPSVEVFDPRLGVWMPVEPMSHPRGYSVSAVLNDTMYVFGGLRDGVSLVKEVESFKEGQGWQETKGYDIWSRCFHTGIALPP